MPAERARIGQSVGGEAINELSGGGLDSSGVMEWLFKEVKYSPSSEINLGAKKIPLPGGLYESYMMYAEAHGIESVRWSLSFRLHSCPVDFETFRLSFIGH